MSLRDGGRLPIGIAVALVVVFAFAVATAPAHANVLNTRVTASKAKKRTCQARLASGTGIVQRRVVARSTGIVQARTRARRGDWDVAIFSRRDGRLVAASAYRGPNELAEGIAAGGEPLTVQACRRSGRTKSARLSVTSIPIPARSGRKIQLVKVLTPTDASKRALERSGVDLTEHARDGFREALLYSDADARKLRKAGLAYTVTIPDVAAADRRARQLSRRSHSRGHAVPSGRTEYRRLADYSADMKRLVEQNPQSVKPITLPYKTLEGRPVEGIEISRDVHRRDGKPVFLQMGVHHAREWPSGEHAMEWAFEMVQGLREQDPRVMSLLGKSRVIVVPIVNPDGFNLSREAGFDVPVGPVGLVLEAYERVQEFAYKRRNCRVRDGALPAPGECALYENRFLGTDPNRNYGGFWGGPGASTAKDDDTYRGAGPFSEPETQNVKALVSSRQVTTLITNHTYSDLVLRPPGLKAEGDPPDEPVYKALGDAMARENGYSSEKSWELYDTTGTTEDWSYYATGGLGFTFEIGRAADGPTGLESLVGVGFHPPYPIGVQLEWGGKQPGGGGNREAYYKALESTANTARHSVITGRAPAGSTLRLRKEFTTYTSPVIDEAGRITSPRSFPDRLSSTMEVGGSGAFEWHVNPSTRPFAKRSRLFSIPADTPASSQAISQASILPPVSLHPIEVRADGPKGAIGAWIDGAEGDDWDIYLYKGTVPDPTQQVASGATESADERLTYTAPAPGRYTLEVRYFTATSGWKGGIDLYGEKDTVSLPAQEETWTLECLRGGRVVGSRAVSVERGQRVDVGAACGGGAAPGDRTPPKVSVGGARVQRVLRQGGVRGALRSSEAGTARVSTLVRVPGRRRAVRLRGIKRSVAAGKRATFKARLTRGSRRALRRGFARRKRLKAVVRVSVRDAAGNTRVVRRPVALKR